MIRTADVDLDGRAQGHRRRDAGARLRPGVRGRRDARQGRRHPQRLRAGRRAAPAPADGRRRADPRRGRADRARTRATSGSSTFWLTDQAGAAAGPAARAARRVVILDGEDDFVNMLRHVLARARHDQRRSSATRTTRRARSTATTWSSSGPGPATRATATTPRSRRSARPSTTLLDAEPAVPGGLPGPPGAVRPARDPAGLQGHRLPGHPVAGRASTGATERVGFYNTFVGRVGDATLPDGRHASRPTRRPATSTWCAGPHYRGIQFHAESILTEHGYDLLHDLVLDLLAT